MVTDNHYRWDFIGLSTDQKPTPATSEKVVDGSTFYCSDNSKLYVFCKDTWYERKALGGGSDITVVQTTGNSTTSVMSQNAVTEALANAGGSVVYYVKSTEFKDGQTINLYKDPSFTTAATILEVWTAAYNCKDIKIVVKGLTENTYSDRITYNVYKTIYPVTCTAESMDEVGFTLYFNDIVSEYSKDVITLQTFSSPENDNFSCEIYAI